jgi:hypothetical protein
VVAGEQERAVRVAVQVGERDGDRAAGVGVRGERGGPLHRPVRGDESDRDEHGRVVTGEDSADQVVVHGGSVGPGADEPLTTVLSWAPC